jgi:hypothetical protein
VGKCTLFGTGRGRCIISIDTMQNILVANVVRIAKRYYSGKEDFKWKFLLERS